MADKSGRGFVVLVLSHTINPAGREKPKTKNRNKAKRNSRTV